MTPRLGRAWPPQCILIVALLPAAFLSGCAPRTSTSSPAPETRVGVVDLQVVTRAHPRWQELDGINRQLQQVEAELATMPPPPAVPSADVQRLLDEEAKRLQAELGSEVAFIHQDGQRRMETFADALREEQEAKLNQVRRQIELHAEQEMMARRNELRAQLRAAEHDIREEYRYPLLNLRLRTEVAGLTSEDEGRQILRQMQALQQEREERIRARAEEAEQAFLDFRRTKESELNAMLRAAQEVLQAEFRQRLVVREREIQAEVTRAAVAREREFHERLARRQSELLRASATQLRNRQGMYAEDLSQRAQRLGAALQKLREQRLRLEDSILAEVKIEVAAIAQKRRLDVVLTRFVANVAGVDITAAVVEKVKR